MKKKAPPSIVAAKTRRHSESRLRDGRKVPQFKVKVPKADADTVRLLHELQVHQIELEMQNEELRKTRDEMEAGRDKYSDLYDFAPVGYLTLDREGTIFEANLAGASLLGVARAALVKRRFGAFVSPVDRSAFAAYLQQVFKSKAREECDVQLLLKDTAAAVVRIRAIASGTGQTCQMAVTDISDRKQAEEKMRLSEIRYRLLFETAHDGVLVLDPATRKITDANPFMSQLLGYPHKQLVGKELFEIGLLKDQAASREMFRKLKLTHIVRYEDLPLKSEDGRHHEVEVVANLYMENGHAVIQCNIRDISARKQAEQELFEKARLLDLSHDAIIVRDMEGHIRYWNHGAEELYGWSRDEVLGKVIHILLQTEFPLPLEQMTEQLHRCNRWIGELVHTTRDGRRLTVLARKTLDRDQHGNPASVLENISDITERKRAEAALRLSNERFDIAVKCSHAVLWQQDLELRYTWLHNPAPGIDGSDVVGKRDEDLLERAEDAAVIMGLKREVIRSGVFLRREYFTQIQGVIHCFELLMEPLRDAAGLIIGLTGAAIDITERKHTEMALQESERQFRALAQASSEVIYRMSADWSSLLPLDGRHLFPSSDQPITDWAWLDINVPTDEHTRVRQAIEKAIAQKTLFELEHRIRRLDGSIGWTLSRAVPILDENGAVVVWFGTASDITERKGAEEAVRAAGERFRFMAESMPQKIFTATAGGEIDYLNAQWMEFTGLTFEQLCDESGWGRYIHPDDVEEIKKVWTHSVESGENFELQQRFRRHDGEYRWHMSRAHAMRDNAGQISMWIGSNTDIDDLIQSQEELIEADAQLADRAVHLEALVAERTHDLTAAHIQLLTEADERKRLETEIASTIESERARLGQELHDGLVQELTGIGMMMHVLAQALTESAPKRASEARRLCLMLEQSHGNARDLAKSFYPVELEQYGLVAALEEIAQRAEKQSGVSCVVQADENAAAPVKDAITSVQLFRIAQEAVQNACKHAQATEILIYLSKRDGAWLLTVKDNGMGLLDNGRKDGGMGLRIMQYRARIIGGKLSVSNAEDGGVIVSCSAPAGDTDKVPCGKD